MLIYVGLLVLLALAVNLLSLWMRRRHREEKRKESEKVRAWNGGVPKHEPPPSRWN